MANQENPGGNKERISPRRQLSKISVNHDKVAVSDKTAGTCDVSVVMPCLNEEATIGRCIQKIGEAFKKHHIKGEVVVVDNGSTDKSTEIARSLSARIVYQPIRGYGAAYLAGISAARGKYIVIGDSDGTYDFSELHRFLQLLRGGNELVMGTRFKGDIRPGAMPWTHRYIGNPVLTGILNLLFNAGVSDAHCGMRAFTRDTYAKLDLQTTGMEFASEMVIQAAKMGLKIAEVPITYYPRKGTSKLNSFRDGWRHLRFMLMLSPTHLFLLPGALFFLLGLAGTIALLPGPLRIGGHAYDIHVMIMTAILMLLGYQILHLGISARFYAVSSGFEKEDRFITRLSSILNLERGLILGGIIFFIGFLINAYIAYNWARSGFGKLEAVRPVLMALVLMVLGAQTVFSIFFLSLLKIPRRDR